MFTGVSALKRVTNMPIYEYLCRACANTSTFFTRSISESLEPACSHCGSPEMRRAVSAFAYHKSLKTVHDESGAPSGPGASSADYYKDPRNIGRHVEDAFHKHGVEMPDSVRDTIDAARQGSLPEGLDL